MKNRYIGLLVAMTLVFGSGHSLGAEQKSTTHYIKKVLKIGHHLAAIGVAIGGIPFFVNYGGFSSNEIKMGGLKFNQEELGLPLSEKIIWVSGTALLLSYGIQGLKKELSGSASESEADDDEDDDMDDMEADDAEQGESLAAVES